jgi:hypothetical protein
LNGISQADTELTSASTTSRVLKVRDGLIGRRITEK